MDIENKNRNLYQELYKAKGDTKKHISTAAHEGKIGTMNVANIKARQATLDAGLESAAFLKNILEVQLRTDDKITEAESYAKDKGYERDDDFNLIQGKKERWYDPESKEHLSLGTVLARKTEAGELKRKGIDKPFVAPTSEYNFDDAMIQFKAREQLDVKLKDRKMGASEGYAKAGSKYEFKKDNPLANIHKYDYVSMLKDFDSIFGENEVVNEVVNDNVLNTEVNPNVATNDAGGSYDALYGDYETDDDGVMRAMPNRGGGGTPYSEDDDFAIDRWW